MMSDEWHDQAVVRVAKQLAGWPRCSPGEFLGKVAEVLDVKEEYRTKGLDFCDLTDLACRVRMAEEEANSTYIDEEARYATTAQARAAVRKLFAHDFPPEVTGRILGLSTEQVEAVKQPHPESREILKLHRAGHHPKVIADRLDIGWGTVVSVLQTLGYEPNFKHKLSSKELQDAIRADRAAGMSLGQIAKKRDVGIDRVKNAVYGARGKHRKVNHGTDVQQVREADSQAN